MASDRYLTTFWGVSDACVKKLPYRLTSEDLIRLKSGFTSFGISEDEANTLDIIFSEVRNTMVP
jgi:hypothetical protein